jgi:flagellar hook-length control protein FliK
MTQAAAAAVAAHLAASGRDRVQGERTARRDDQQSQAAAVGLESADVDPGQTAFTIGKDKAGSAVLERVATDKFLHAGRDLFEFKQGASLETRLVQQHAAEAALPAGMNLGAAAPAPVAQAATATIAAHLAAPGWDRALGEKVVWMAGQKMQVAELHLNPPELGPLQITLTLSNDQASAQFVSQHAAVRDAIETAMPRLREMLAEGGIMLGNTSVSAESFGGQAQAQPDARSYIPRGAPPAETGAEFRSAQAPRATRGLVDIFA